MHGNLGIQEIKSYLFELKDWNFCGHECWLIATVILLIRKITQFGFSKSRYDEMYFDVHKILTVLLICNDKYHCTKNEVLH